MAAKRVLVIAPHADDEVFGCGGTIAKLTTRGISVDLLVMALGIPNEDISNRTIEMGQSCNILGITNRRVLFRGEDTRLDTIPQVNMIDAIERTLAGEHYDTIIYPYPSHHQDHRAVESACVSVFRPGGYFNPDIILMYEYTYPAWGSSILPGGRLYEDISGTIDIKKKAIKAYRSQLRKFPHPVSIGAMLTMAKARGLAVGYEHAELFYVVQMKGAL